MKSYSTFIVTFLILVNSLSFAFGQDITLSWDPSPTAGVDGYKVYYKHGDMILPFDGSGAQEGPSPVDVGDTLSTTLTGLNDGVTYYFSVTAYQDPDVESTFSNIVSNSWLPALSIPDNNATDEPVPVTFRWETAPSGYDVNYTLFYGTDRDEVTSATAITLPPPSPKNRIIPIGLVLILTLFLLKQLKYRPLIAAQQFMNPVYTLMIVVLAGGILSACGGGGGGGGETSTERSATSTETSEPDSVLYSINKGSSDYHQAFDLTGSTTYYWKVVATDTQDPNLTYESEVRSFTTEDF
ncbi:Fibronectin type III domain-containing protein [Desulfuromusa kysingii]|uniref:Fibronectin type III domain-containing protein n=1 Tax=Desulfuromusa kysingii TaxID=37625 RepID=A0A1H4BBW0_9BACT|nr:fibronectin type III domain-containing protein [Desulfuromusa kysingii]SEA45534.1 Fibronectin type III domain-containing protein [Desulfuromusa kysingii]